MKSNKELRNILKTNDGTEGMVQQCLNITRGSNKIIIFGAGVGGVKLYELLKANGLQDRIAAFSDNNALKFYKTYADERLIVMPPKELPERFGVDSCVIIVASSAYDVIKKQLLSYGYPESSIFLFNFAFMDLKYTDKEFIWDHIDDFQRAYERMRDEKSRNIFADILNYRITKDEMYLYRMQEMVDDEEEQYFPRDIIELESEECFLDIGAYTGDTFRTFNEVYKGEWRAYIGLEADQEAYRELLKTLRSHEKDGRIRTYNLAAWNREDVLYYQENPGSSSMSGETGKNKTAVKAAALDDVLTDEKVTFIKMDIEGAEFQAISGMKILIERNHPVIAMSVYHRRDDFYRLTDLLEEICGNVYVYYFRQYRFTPTETVCYAVPIERTVSKLKI